MLRSFGGPPETEMPRISYATQKRTLKNSALWYREFIASNGASLPA